MTSWSQRQTTTDRQWTNDMKQQEKKTLKVYYSIGEVAEMFGVNTSLIRFWEKEFDILNETCLHKFRKTGDVNQWVMKFWQLAAGKFNVRPDDFARCYHVKKSTYKRMLRDLRHGTHPMICINDNARTFHFEAKKKQVNAIFNRRLPEQSSFELYDAGAQDKPENQDEN